MRVIKLMICIIVCTVYMYCDEMYFDTIDRKTLKPFERNLSYLWDYYFLDNFIICDIRKQAKTEYPFYILYNNGGLYFIGYDTFGTSIRVPIMIRDHDKSINSQEFNSILINIQDESMVRCENGERLHIKYDLIDTINQVYRTSYKLVNPIYKSEDERSISAEAFVLFSFKSKIFEYYTTKGNHFFEWCVFGR